MHCLALAPALPLSLSLFPSHRFAIARCTPSHKSVLPTTSTIMTASAAETLSRVGLLISSQPAMRRATVKRVASSARALAKLPNGVHRSAQTSSASQSPKTRFGCSGVTMRRSALSNEAAQGRPCSVRSRQSTR